MALPVRGLGTGNAQTDFSSLGRRFVVARDNNGRFFIVDTQQKRRFALGDTTSGSYRAAVTLYGRPVTGVYLSGYRERAAVDVFGGPNRMEQVIAGLIRNPLTGRYVGNDPTTVLDRPQEAATKSGDLYRPRPKDRPESQRPNRPREQGPSDAYAQMADILRSVDLPQLIPWARKQVQRGVTVDQFLLSLRDQKPFRQRFGVIFDLEDQNDQLVPGGGLEQQVQAVLRFEQTAEEIMEYLPRRFRRRDYIHGLIRNRVSVEELALRVDEGFQKVRQSPREVREAFGDFFGASGDAALAAHYLDPDVSEEALLEELTVARVGGAGLMFGFDVGKNRARRLARLGFGFEASLQGFSRAASLRPLETETFGETDQIGESAIINAGFGIGPDAERRLERRRQNRAAAGEATSGAAVTSGGLLSLGGADNTGV